MEVANEIMKGVAQVLMVPAKRQLDYVISYGKHVEDMRTKRDELNAERDREEEHLKQNRERHLEAPAQVSEWLSKVEDMNAKVDKFPQEVLGCFDLKSRHKLGRRASKIIKEIDSLTTQHSQIRWTDQKIPVGRIDFTNASTSTPSSDRDEFPSRVQTYNKAFEALGPNHKSHMVALCGMGGVGKTTMMKKLRQAVIEKNMFGHFVEAVIGEKTDPIVIQNAVAEYLGIELTESTKPARTEKLRKWFANNSDEGKKKFLVILDDVWQPVDLEDIGLSPFPDQGVDFKVLITSRDHAVCTEMGVEANSVLKVSLLEEAEAQSLFHQFWKPSDDVDPELYKIGENIVTKCCCLPIAIKTMACTLRSKSKDAWKTALSRLEHHDIKTVAGAVFKTSYDNLQDVAVETIFLLCGLFPEDSDISTEELLRYGWGLKLFKGVGAIKEARTRLNTCIERLIHTNLLIESDAIGCVKMHDLVRAFVLDMFSKVEHASIVNDGSGPGWPEDDMSASSCKRISITCEGMSEFPSDLNFPNLSILKLMHGDESLRFPRGFYGEMEKLQVISYDRMVKPLLPSSLECSTNLRVLCLHRCSLAVDFSSVGDLLNLEVLSFANSDIKSLPSTIGMLKKLRVLDVSDCGGLHIDNSVFKNLVKLEELYAWAVRGAISFTGESSNEVVERLHNLSALEFEFVTNDALLKNLSSENLERFKISVGRSLEGEYFIKSKHSFENTLKLVTNKGEVSASKINELFEKTEVLCLSVDDMNDIEDVGVKSSLPPQPSPFGNLRILVITECAELKYLFTLDVAKVLSNLEHLVVDDCPVMKELIHTEDRGEETITLPKLKFLSLKWLPELLGLCQNVNIIALPQLVEFKIIGISNIKSIYSKDKPATYCLLREEVLIPKLEKLHIEDMDDVTEIWPCEFSTSEEVQLKEIEVSGCKKLVNLFPCNPMSLLHHLEELTVRKCGSIEALFNIDLDCVGKIGESHSSSRLRKIKIYDLGKLREVWRIKGGENNSRLPIRGFQAVESIEIDTCKMFRNVFTPTTTNFDLGALTYMKITDSGEIERKYGLVESNQGQKIDILSEEETSEEVGDSISNYSPISPFWLTQSFHNLRNLQLERYQGVEVIFEMESTPRSQDNQQRILPYLEELSIRDMERISHVWKCNWNEFSILQKQPSESPFHNLTTLYVTYCKGIKYLFSPLMAKHLSNLKKIFIRNCDGMEEVVSNRDDEDEGQITSTTTHTSTTFPHLNSLTLVDLRNLECIGGDDNAKGGNNAISFTSTSTSFLDQYKCSYGDGVSWTLCQYPREISITHCHALSSVIPCYAAGQMQKLQVLKIEWCSKMKEVFETQEINKSVIMLKLDNLKILAIKGCGSLEYIFTFSTLETLRHLEELRIQICKALKVIVKEEDGGSSKVVVFPHLNWIVLEDLEEVVGFFLGTNEFHWPSLDEVAIIDCPQMKVFTAGGSTAPHLKYVRSSLGIHTAGPEFNSHGTTTDGGQHQERTGSLYPASTLKGNHWSFHNLIHIRATDNSLREYVIVPSNELLHLQKLETIHLKNCHLIREVFGIMEGTNSTGFDESPTVVEIPNLRQVDVNYVSRLRYMWKSNRWTIFEFPNLTTVSIDDCINLRHVFTSSMVGSLKQLQELSISFCKSMKEVIVKDANAVVEEEEEESDGKMNEIVLPRLKSIKLVSLKCFKGFCLGKEDFSFPLLDTFTITYCPAITTFTKGNSSTPELKKVETDFGSFCKEEDINSFIEMKQQDFKGHQLYEGDSDSE